MNLLATSVRCEKAESGLLSLGLRKCVKLEYSEDGKVQMEFEMNLHYPLIDRTEGYRPEQQKEPDNFIPFVDTVKGKLKGEFKPRLEDIPEEQLQERVKKPLKIQLKFDVELVAEKYWVKRLIADDIIAIVIIVVILQNVLNIQPVFIRSSPSDTSPTGWSFDTMMQSAKCIWRKCCVFFNVLKPIYVDKGAYKVLNSLSEAISLLSEVNVDNAVEIFVVDRWDPIWDGCGASFSSGTANAKIVTCDEQLKVPDPNNPGSYLGAVNVNHLAHELGHVMSLDHPGVVVISPMTASGTPNTVMEPSGFYADNPHQQSMHNCNNVASPLFRLSLTWVATRCIRNPEIV